MADDAELLRQFATDRDEAAFRELVDRYFGLVYSVALRQMNGDAHLAQDVAQTVFTDLARKARYLSSRPVLGGWLYDAARFAANNITRAERRRRAREREASTNCSESIQAHWFPAAGNCDSKACVNFVRSRQAIMQDRSASVRP